MTDRSDSRMIGRSEGQAPDEAPLPPRMVEAVRAEYHVPPAVPTDEIWNRIQAARRAETPSSGGATAAGSTFRPSDLPAVRLPWLRYATGIAALLALGIGIGRMTSSSPEAPPSGPVATVAERPDPAYTITTVNHLSRVETFLTALRTDPAGGTFAGQARDLLTSTRLLLDSKGAADPRIRALLEDLELILVQVTALGDPGSREEMDLITDGLEQREVLPRLRTMIPSGTAREL